MPEENLSLHSQPVNKPGVFKKTKKLLDLIIFPILIVMVIIYILAWAPWVTDSFAHKKALASLNPSCRELNQNEYPPQIIEAIYRIPTLQQTLGLDPLFGSKTDLYIICGNKPAHNFYFVSFYGSVTMTSTEIVSLKTLSDRETANWKTYSDEKVLFKYPNTWNQKPLQLYGSGFSVEIDDSQGVFVFTFNQRGNYNNETQKPFRDLYEYIDFTQVAKPTVGGQQAVQPLPRAGSEDIYLVDFFSKDIKLIYSIDLEPKNRTPDRVRPENEEKIFNQILSTFKFL